MGFVYVDQISKLVLEQSVQVVWIIVCDIGNGKVQIFGVVEYCVLYISIDLLQSMIWEEKLDILCWVDKVVWVVDQWVQEVLVSLSGVYELILIVVIDGILVVDVCLLVCFFVSVLVEEDGKCECGSSGGGGCFGYDYFFVFQEGDVWVDVWVKEVVCMVLVNFLVVVVFVGMLLVVFGVGWSGVLLYEVVGYGLEGDFNWCGILVFSGYMGELVVFELCIVVDDGIIVDCCGLVVIDDEGMLG